MITLISYKITKYQGSLKRAKFQFQPVSRKQRFYYSFFCFIKIVSLALLIMEICCKYNALYNSNNVRNSVLPIRTIIGRHKFNQAIPSWAKCAKIESYHALRTRCLHSLLSLQYFSNFIHIHRV